MVFSLDSSLVLVAIVGLWLVWVAPFLLRRATPDLAATSVPTMHAGTTRSRKTLMTMTAPQDDQHRRDGAPEAGAARGVPSLSDGSAAGTAAADRAGTARSIAGRMVRSGLAHAHWGRLGVALLGTLALLSILVSLVLMVLGLVSPAVPLIGLAVAVAAVATLRVFAIRSRRARVDRAFAEAMAPARPDEAVPARSVPVAAAPRRPTTLFDADDTPARRLTAMELRTAALAVAHGATAVDLRAEATDTAAAAAATTGAAWAPVEVPRPTYVDAAKAERRAPAPLDLPEAPKATTKTPIKASEAAARFAEVTEGVEPTAPGAAPATGRINLDDVLQRRRA